VTSKFKGVSWVARPQKWKAQIYVDGKRKHLGLFDDETTAARAYDEVAAAKMRPLNFKVNSCEDEASNIGRKQDKVEKQEKKTPLSASSDTAKDEFEMNAASTSKSLDAEKAGVKKSRFAGLSWLQSKKLWAVRIVIGGKRSHLGHFQDEEAAARKYDEVAATVPGKALNFPRAAPMQPCINGDVGDFDAGKVQNLEVKTVHDDLVATNQKEFPPDALESSKEVIQKMESTQGDLGMSQGQSNSATKVPSDTSDSSDDESEDGEPTKLETSSEDGDSDEIEVEEKEEDDEEEDEFSGAARIETALLAATNSKNIQGVLSALASASSFEMSLVVLKTTGLAKIVGRLRRHSDLNVSKAATELVKKWKELR